MSLKLNQYLIKLRLNLKWMISNARGKFNEDFVVFIVKVNNYEGLIYCSSYLISVYWMIYRI